MAAVIVALLVAGVVYLGFFWWPVQAAGDLMKPSSEDFAGSVADLQVTVNAYPSGETLEGSGAVIEAAPAARDELSGAQLRLENRRVLSIPILSSRPAFSLAQDLKEQMMAFYTVGLEAVGDLEAVARYLNELEPLVPALGNVRKALGAPKTGGEIEDAVASAEPIAEQLRADLRALDPPDELGAAHTSLLAITRGIQEDLDEIERVGGGSPVLRALLKDIRSQLDSFRKTASEAPFRALEGGLGQRLATLNRRSATITDGLIELRDKGVGDLSIPENPAIGTPL